MTEAVKTVLEQYQVRKSKKQKRRFREYLTSFAERLGYSCRIEKGLGAENLVIGDPEQAKVVYTAHYDTCVQLPFPNFITPKHFPIYLAYQLLLTVVLCTAVIALGTACGFAAGFLSYLLVPNADPAELIFWCTELPLIALVFLMLAGPANQHTVNDNTSGVATLMELMEALPVAERASIAFVFFDLEEAGLVGSMAFRFKHGKALKNKPLLNFDCVSDGENLLFAVSKKASHLAPILEECFPETEQCRVEVLTKGVFYPSDQANFPLGVGIAALKRMKNTKILYMDRIHTSRDRIYREENITFLKEGALRFAKAMAAR